jgi:hypothetical protein
MTGVTRELKKAVYAPTLSQRPDAAGNDSVQPQKLTKNDVADLQSLLDTIHTPTLVDNNLDFPRTTITSTGHNMIHSAKGHRAVC